LENTKIAIYPDTHFKRAELVINMGVRVTLVSGLPSQHLSYLLSISSRVIDEVLDGLKSHDWVVYTKHCLNHTASIIDYLARYTHRSAITNARI
jgi:hypothetical protein